MPQAARARVEKTMHDRIKALAGKGAFHELWSNRQAYRAALSTPLRTSSEVSLYLYCASLPGCGGKSNIPRALLVYNQLVPIMTEHGLDVRYKTEAQLTAFASSAANHLAGYTHMIDFLKKNGLTDEYLAAKMAFGLRKNSTSATATAAAVPSVPSAVVMPPLPLSNPTTVRPPPRRRRKVVLPEVEVVPEVVDKSKCASCMRTLTALGRQKCGPTDGRGYTHNSEAYESGFCPFADVNRDLPCVPTGATDADLAAIVNILDARAVQIVNRPRAITNYMSKMRMRAKRKKPVGTKVRPAKHGHSDDDDDDVAGAAAAAAAGDYDDDGDDDDDDDD